MKIKTGFGGGPEYDGGIRFTCQFKVSADKIRMKMSFEDIFDNGIVVFRNLQIEIWIPYGVDDGSFSITWNKVRSFA